MKWSTLTRREGLRQALRAGLYGAAVQLWPSHAQDMACLLYTSDAADE